VLALLLLNANRVVSTERLIDDLWGGTPPDTARAALQVYVAGLRRALGSEGAALRTKPPGYVLEVGRGALDLDRFNDLRAEARAATDAERRAAALHEALELWQDTSFPELRSEPFWNTAAAHLEEVRLSALEETIDADLALGRHAHLVPELDGLVTEYPYRERLRAQLMLALYRSGRQADALEAYQRARRTFSEDLGLEPSPPLAELERAILRHDASLAAPSLAASPSPRDDRWAGSRRVTPRTMALAVALAAILALAAAFVAKLRATSTPTPTPVAIAGDSVAVVDPERNAVIGEIPVGARPSGIAAGAGSVWVGNRDDNTLLRIDPRSRKVVRTIGLPLEPQEVTVAADAVWVATDDGVVVRIDPSSNQIARAYRLRRTRDRCCPPAITTGGTAVWVSQGGTLSRIDPSTNGVAQVRDAGVVSITSGEGGLWLLTSAGKLERLDPTTNAVLTSISRESIAYGALGGGVAAGAGAVWTGTYLDRALWKLDPVTGAFIGRVPLAHRPAGVAFSDGAVWIVTTDGMLLRVDPRSDRVVRTIRLGAFAAQAGSGELEAQGRWAPMVAAAGALWIPVTP
jgi:DNA-binding SARP family transcriptional activator/streptogramin lyase